MEPNEILKFREGLERALSMLHSIKKLHSVPFDELVPLVHSLRDSYSGVLSLAESLTDTAKPKHEFDLDSLIKHVEDQQRREIEENRQAKWLSMVSQVLASLKSFHFVHRSEKIRAQGKAIHDSAIQFFEQAQASNDVREELFLWLDEWGCSVELWRKRVEQHGLQEGTIPLGNIEPLIDILSCLDELQNRSSLDLSPTTLIVETNSNEHKSIEVEDSFSNLEKASKPQPLGLSLVDSMKTSIKTEPTNQSSLSSVLSPALEAISPPIDCEDLVLSDPSQQYKIADPVYPAPDSNSEIEFNPTPSSIDYQNTPQANEPEYSGEELHSTTCDTTFSGAEATLEGTDIPLGSTHPAPQGLVEFQHEDRKLTNLDSTAENNERNLRITKELQTSIPTLCLEGDYLGAALLAAQFEILNGEGFESQIPSLSALHVAACSRIGDFNPSDRWLSPEYVSKATKEDAQLVCFAMLRATLRVQTFASALIPAKDSYLAHFAGAAAAFEWLQNAWDCAIHLSWDRVLSVKMQSGNLTEQAISSFIKQFDAILQSTTSASYASRALKHFCLNDTFKQLRSCFGKQPIESPDELLVAKITSVCAQDVQNILDRWLDSSNANRRIVMRDRQRRDTMECISHFTSCVKKALKAATVPKLPAQEQKIQSWSNALRNVSGIKLYAQNSNWKPLLDDLIEGLINV